MMVFVPNEMGMTEAELWRWLGSHRKMGLFRIFGQA